MSKFARELKAFRKRHGMSQAKLAAMAGTHQPLICCAEKDTRAASEATQDKVRKAMARHDAKAAKRKASR